MCGTCYDPDYNVYNTLAKATNGQVFHLGKADVGDVSTPYIKIFSYSW